MRLDRRHRAWVGDPHRLSSYLSYGRPLVAVADGTVVSTRDGNSATPHLHLQAQVTKSFLGDGLPWVFGRFEMVGQITEHFSDEDLGLRPTGQLPYTPARRPGVRRDQMPLSQNVVRFIGG